MPHSDSQSEFPTPPLHTGQDVTVECSERGDIERLETPSGRKRQQTIEDRKHRTLGFAGTGWSYQYEMFSMKD